MEAASIAPVSLTAAKAAASQLKLTESQQYVQSIAYLTAGIWCVKFPFEQSINQSKPKNRFLFYGVDEVDGECLYWCDSTKKKRSKDRMIPFHSITSLVESIQTAAFKRAMLAQSTKQNVSLTNENANSCFSIVGKKRTLDLQCTDQAERDRFVSALHVILMHNKQLTPQSSYQPANQSTMYSALNSPITSSAATNSNFNSNAPQKDMFVISVKARNLPVMPWTDDDTNDTIVCVYEKNARTLAANSQSNGYQLVESSEWQLNNSMPNFRTPLLVPFNLPLQPTDLLKFSAFDRIIDDAHLVGSAVVRASALMNNAGHEMMVKLKNSATPTVDRLLQGSNAYLLLTSTCKTSSNQTQSNTTAARPPAKPVASPAQQDVQTKPVATAPPAVINQPFTNVLQEYNSAIQNNKKPVALPASAVALPTFHPQSETNSAANNQPSSSVAPSRRRSIVAADSRRSSSSRPSSRRSSIDQIVNQSLAHANKLPAHLIVEPTTRQRSASTQLPKTTLSFLQAGDQFFVYPSKKCSNNSIKHLVDRCSTSFRLLMEGPYGTLVISSFQEDCESDSEDDPAIAKSKEIVRIPFELIYQAKIGIGPGCFNRSNPSIKLPKASRCFSLLIKDRAASDARIDYWLDVECRSSNKRDAWAAAFNQLISYIHLPAQASLNQTSSQTAGRSSHHKSSKEERSATHHNPPISSSVSHQSSASSPSETAPSTPVEIKRSIGASVKSKAVAFVEERVDTLAGNQSIEPVKHTKQAVIAGVLVHSAQTEETIEDKPAASAFDPAGKDKHSALNVARSTGMKLGSSNVLQPQLDELEMQLSGAPRTSIIKDSSNNSATQQSITYENVIVIGENIPMAPDVPFAPPMAPSIDGPPTGPTIPAVRLRKLHWQAFDADDELQGTIWTDKLVDQNNIASTDAIDQEANEMLIKLFSLKSSEKKKKDEDSASATMKSRGIFDSKRGQNIEIALKSFRMPYSALYEAVQSIDFTILNVERVVSLINCCPTPEELVAMKAWETKQTLAIKQSDNPSDDIDYTLLPAAEQFAFLMQSIPRYHWRLKSILFVLKFDDLVLHCIKSCQKLFKTCQSVKQSMRFRHILQLILTVGNTLNRTQTKAFHLSSLTALSTTKSTDGKTSLIDFLVMYIDRLQQAAKQSSDSKKSSSSSHGYLSEVTPLVRASCLMDLNQLAADRSSLVDGLEELQNELQSHPAAYDSDVFHVTMSEFVERAQSKADELNSSWGAFTESSRSLLLYLNEVGSLTLSESLECIDAFLSQFSASETKLEQNKVEQRKQCQAHSRQQSLAVLPSQPMEAIMREHVGRLRQDSDTWAD